MFPYPFGPGMIQHFPFCFLMSRLRCTSRLIINVVVCWFVTNSCQFMDMLIPMGLLILLKMSVDVTVKGLSELAACSLINFYRGFYGQKKRSSLLFHQWPFLAGLQNLPVSFSYQTLFFRSTLSHILLKIMYTLLMLSTFSRLIWVTANKVVDLRALYHISHGIFQ